MTIPRANRDPSLLKSEFRKAVDQWISSCRAQGFDIFLTETHRTKQRQQYLYSLGRTRPGRRVTWTLNSMHMEGLAADIAFRGPELYPRSFHIWEKVADIAHGFGIDRGYSLWKRDKPHFQWRGLPESKIILDKRTQKVLDHLEIFLSRSWNILDPYSRHEKIRRIQDLMNQINVLKRGI